MTQGPYRPSFARAGFLILALAVVVACRPPEQASPKRQPAKSGRATAPAQSLQPATLNGHELSDGWISLFDGQTLFGWDKQCEADWRVEDGAIVVSKGEVGLLCSTTQFDNYVLKAEFRGDKETNSGIFLRTTPKPTDPAGDCYELNIAPPDNPFPTGSLVKRKKAEGKFNSADWQTYEVTVDGPRIVVKLDGRQILDYTDARPIGRGYIGLQHNQGQVAFRNLRIKPLGLQSIFNGKDLSGWQEYPSDDYKFTATEEGLLNVKGGRGQLETESSYGDFVLQLECITHAENLNSGIFFRCVPGSRMDGYESQIHNGFKDGNRSQPVDHGTGGIFRRQNAHYVVADDKKWFHKTVITDGPHMAVWVNGFQVSDWTDTRAPNKNPRAGRRTDAGTIMIQAHDATTDISFRNLRIAPLAPPLLE